MRSSTFFRESLLCRVAGVSERDVFSLLILYALIAFFSFTGFSESAWAQGSSRTSGHGGASTYNIYFDETFFPVYVDKNDTTSINTAPGVATETGLGFDTHTTIGYMFFGDSLVVGLSYNYYRLTTKRANVPGGDSGLNETTVDWQFGPSVGWLYGGFRALVMFYVSGNKNVHTINFDQTGNTGDIAINNDGISGFQLTLGYTFQLWGDVEIGPTLLYKSLTYKKQSKTNVFTPAENYPDSSLYSPHIDHEVEPMVTLLCKF